MYACAVAAGGCAARPMPPANNPNLPNNPTNAANPNLSTHPGGSEVSGVWDAMSQTTIGEGIGAGDTRIEKQEWHLTQDGRAITGYYIAALTFVSGDGRPYVCSRQPQFSAMQRFNVVGRVLGGQIEIQELEQRAAQAGNHCDPGLRQLARYNGRLDGDVLTLVNGAQRRTLYRIHNPGDAEMLVARADPGAQEIDNPGIQGHPGAQTATASAAGSTDVSGLWIWEHHGVVPGGDEKQEREEWHVTQDGSALTGYYDRIVHQVSIDGHAYRCSMALDFQIATRYQFTGEVRGDQIAIYESSYQVLEPSACDNGKRRLDAYEGQASPEELRLVWGVGGQILRRARPGVPTQRF
ncbi:MAG TPA: hypothetical protein VKO16_11190 [Polyangia bacterium]|nr:hypothetical protein [Polyangia bacterium]